MDIQNMTFADAVSRIMQIETELAHWAAEADRHAGTAQHALAELATANGLLDEVESAASGYVTSTGAVYLLSSVINHILAKRKDGE